MEKLFHGTSVLFDRFDLSHALEGDGKCKFGYGVYLTQSYDQAALYARKSGAGKLQPTGNYVYIVHAPRPKGDNFISLVPGVPVNPAIVERAQEKLGQAVPQEVATEGKFFRKYIGNLLTGMIGSVKKMTSKASIEAERAASEFLRSIGVELYVWPISWKKPDDLYNVAVLDESKIDLLQIEQVEFDERNRMTSFSRVWPIW